MRFSDADLESIGSMYDQVAPLHKMDRWIDPGIHRGLCHCGEPSLEAKSRGAERHGWDDDYLMPKKVRFFPLIRWYQGFLTWLYGDFQLVSSKNGLQFWWFQTTSPPAVLTCGPQVRQRLHKRLGAMLPPEDWESLGSLQNKTMEKTHGVNPLVKSLQNETLRILFLTLVSGKTPPYRRDFRCRIWYVPRSVRWWCFSRSLKRPPSDFATWKRPPPKVGEWWEGDFLLMRTGSDP